jgi:hypothetical protein
VVWTGLICSVQRSIHNATSLPAFLLGLLHVLTQRQPVSHLSPSAHTSLRTENLRLITESNVSACYPSPHLQPALLY